MLGPIFAREFRTVPRRAGHYGMRAASLGLLWTLGITAWLATGGLGAEPEIGDTARFGLLLFQIFTYVLLALTTFFAALSAASAVAQEKDRRTFVLLLMTDLRDFEIVLGKLLGSLLPIVLVLLGTLPVLMMLLLLGGVTLHQVVYAWLVIVTTGLAAGSLGGLVALWRDRTFQSLALSVLALVLYFCAVRALGALPPGNPSAESWLGRINWPGLTAYLDPFVALQSVLEPPESAVDLGGAKVWGYIAVMIAWSVALNAWGLFKLRDWNPGGEPIQQREALGEDEDKDRARAHAAGGAARRVWKNPIVWREICTRGYGRRPILVKLFYGLVLSLILYAALTPILNGPRVPFASGYGLVPVTILSLLLVAAQAVTAITSERDGRTLDLLLVTDLSPKEFIFGKLGGVLYNTKEYVLPPLILAAAYAWLGLLATPPANRQYLSTGMNITALLAVWGAIVVLLAFVLVLGIHIALRVVNSRQAVTNALGTVFFLSVGTLVCIYLILINGGTFEYQIISFSLFIVVGIGGLWWVLSADRPTQALTLASVLLPIAMFYCVTNILVATPGSQESAPPLIPFLALLIPFTHAILAMLVPMLSEFDVAFGRTRLDE
jgi:ABC-type transport system involved in multi-copper enzyme maturation permease subunit